MSPRPQPPCPRGPAALPVSLVLPLVACGGDITGVWDLDSVGYEGTEVSYPQVVSASDTNDEGYT